MQNRFVRVSTSFWHKVSTCLFHQNNQGGVPEVKKLPHSSNNEKKSEVDSTKCPFDVIPCPASAATVAPNWEENDNLMEVAWKLMTEMQHPFACTEACKDSPYTWNPYLLQNDEQKRFFRLGGLPPMWSQAIPSSGHMSSCASILEAHISAHMVSLFVYSTPFFRFIESESSVSETAVTLKPEGSKPHLLMKGTFSVICFPRSWFPSPMNIGIRSLCQPNSQFLIVQHGVCHHFLPGLTMGTLFTSFIIFLGISLLS